MNDNFIKLVVLIFFLKIIMGCFDSSVHENETPIGVRRQHDTRVILICKDKQGKFCEESIHASKSLTCGKRTFKLSDFAKVKQQDSYIAFPGQENELRKYLKAKGINEQPQ